MLAYDPVAPLPLGVEPLPTLDAIPPRAMVLLAVHPQLVRQVASALRVQLRKLHVVVSIAAGVTLQTLRALLGTEAALVRPMPNTPAALGMGMTTLVAEGTFDPETRIALEAPFGTTGAFLWPDAEGQLDRVTAISGSGLAYFFRFADALAAAGVAQGPPEPTAYELARATLAGPGAALAELRAEVTSPSGTTAAALDAPRGLERLADDAVRAAIRRTGELATEAMR